MKKKHLLATIAWAFAGSAAFASPADDVMTPDIEKGEREVEFAYGADRNDAASTKARWGSVLEQVSPTAGRPNLASSSSASAAST